MALTPLPPGMTGAASFDRPDAPTRRHWLRRWWNGRPRETTPFALWIGMNPSQAGKDVNDPTICKVIKFTRRRFQLNSLVMVNVGDYIATDTDDVKRVLGAMAGKDIVSPTNLQTVLSYAERAAIIVVCFGEVPDSLQGYANHLVTLLLDRGLPLYCLGKNKSGNPKHPLYIWDDAPFIPYP